MCVCHTAFCVLTRRQNRRQLGIGIRRQLGIAFRVPLTAGNPRTQQCKSAPEDVAAFPQLPWTQGFAQSEFILFLSLSEGLFLQHVENLNNLVQFFSGVLVEGGLMESRSSSAMASLCKAPACAFSSFWPWKGVEKSKLFGNSLNLGVRFFFLWPTHFSLRISKLFL